MLTIGHTCIEQCGVHSPPFAQPHGRHTWQGVLRCRDHTQLTQGQRMACMENTTQGRQAGAHLAEGQAAVQLGVRVLDWIAVVDAVNLQAGQHMWCCLRQLESYPRGVCGLSCPPCLPWSAA